MAGKKFTSHDDNTSNGLAGFGCSLAHLSHHNIYSDSSSEKEKFES